MGKRTGEIEGAICHLLNNLFKLPHPGPNDPQGACGCRRHEGPNRLTFAQYVIGAASTGAQCQEIAMPDGSTQLAKPTSTGWSTTGCEPQITVRLTERVGTWEIKGKVTATRCTVWVNTKNGTRDTVPAAWDACLAAMRKAAEAPPAAEVAPAQ